MRDGPVFLRRVTLVALCLIIFLVMVFLINAIPKSAGNGEQDEPSVSVQYTGNYITTSHVPTLISTEFPEPTIGQQTDVPSGSSNSVCSTIWGIELPTILPEWLKTPANAEGLYTEVKYYILAGHLISEGSVNASDCPDGGLLTNGNANTCGMEKATTQVINWQNQFNQDIFTAAENNRIPAVVLKRLFAQETQFWPPNSSNPPAYGIGAVTSPGIEPLFKWDDYTNVFQNTCRELFSPQSCRTLSYSSLSLNDQQMLRGFFIKNYIHSYCDSCTKYHIDLDKTRRSIDYFAKLMVASCAQINESVRKRFSMKTLPYETAWRLALVEYAVGTNCIDDRIAHMDVSKSFSWDYFNEGLGPGCSADIYLSAITR